jgi:hypothetical protein
MSILYWLIAGAAFVVLMLIIDAVRAIRAERRRDAEEARDEQLRAERRRRAGAPSLSDAEVLARYRANTNRPRSEVPGPTHRIDDQGALNVHWAASWPLRSGVASPEPAACSSSDSASSGASE